MTTLRLRWLLVGIGVHVHVGVGATPEFERITFRVLTVAVVPTIAVRTSTIAEVIAMIRYNVRLRDARNHVATAIARIRHLDRRPVRAGLWLIMQVVLFPIDRGLLEVHVDGGVIPHCDGDGSHGVRRGHHGNGGPAGLPADNGSVFTVTRYSSNTGVATGPRCDGIVGQICSGLQLDGLVEANLRRARDGDGTSGGASAATRATAGTAAGRSTVDSLIVLYGHCRLTRRKSKVRTATCTATVIPTITLVEQEFHSFKARVVNRNTQPAGTIGNIGQHRIRALCAPTFIPFRR